MRILVAEDERDIRSMIKFVLERNGYEVIEAANGVEALELAKNKSPDAVLLDVMMPEMDGYQVCLNLRSNPDTQNIPVVFLSAKGQVYEIDKGLKSGAIAYIVKPFAPKELVAQLKEIFGQR